MRQDRTASKTSPGHATGTTAVRVGVVSFLNTLPLIHGLDRLGDVSLKHSVPSCLIDDLLSGETDLALCSSIDYQRSPEDLVVVPVGLLGCDGPTLTVRLYSKRPIEAIDEVFCDTDSHTSVALLRILLRERWGIAPTLTPYHAREHVSRGRPVDWPPAMLLIGDKVVTDSPPAVRYPHQLDLGEAWRELTGLPFVFATWMAKASTPAERIAPATLALDRQRRRNAGRIETIIAEHASERGWPLDLAETYLRERLAFDPSPERWEGMRRFFDRAREHGLVESTRPIRFLDPRG